MPGLGDNGEVGADTAAMDPIPRALQIAARTRRPHYVLRGEILDARPTFGPFMIAWPNGDVEAIGVGRKKQRQRRNSGLEDDPGDEEAAEDEPADETASEAADDEVVEGAGPRVGVQSLLDLGTDPDAD